MLLYSSGSDSCVSITFTGRILLGPARDTSVGLGTEGFHKFPGRLFRELLYWLATFLDSVPYILTITTLFGIPFVSYPYRFTTLTTSCFVDCVVILVVRIRSLLIVSLIPLYNPLGAGWEGNEPAAQKSAGIYLL